MCYIGMSYAFQVVNIMYVDLIIRLISASTELSDSELSDQLLVLTCGIYSIRGF